MVCNHYCNEPMRCPECAKRFWAWAEHFTASRGKKAASRRGRGCDVPFYEAAAKFIGRDNRRVTV